MSSARRRTRTYSLTGRNRTRYHCASRADDDSIVGMVYIGRVTEGGVARVRFV